MGGKGYPRRPPMQIDRRTVNVLRPLATWRWDRAALGPG
jgi:hypothetical protein